MDTLLVLLVVLSSSYATELLPGHCEDEKVKVLKELVDIHREKGDALKEMVETQRHKDEEVVALIRSVGKVDKLQTLEESHNELGLALTKLAGRLDVIEAKKVDKLQTLEENHELGLALTKLAGRLDVIEAKMDTQLDEMTSKLKVMQASCEEALQRFEDKLEAMQDTYEGVAALERQGTPGSTRVSSVACQPLFEPVGDDCVHWHNEGMTWENAQQYCQTLGAKLIVPAVKEGFELAYGTRSMSDPHPPLFDFLYEKSVTYGWIGASVDEENKVSWTSGEELKRDVNRLDGDDHLACIAAMVQHGDRSYATWTVGCDMTFPTTLCQQQQVK